MIGRVSKFLHDFYKKNGANGYFLKCDIRKFSITSIRSAKTQISNGIEDKQVLSLLYQIIDSLK